jgi:hydrogenase nickel incorporation protein HypA/HybF
VHELSLVAGLFDILEEKAREQKAIRITAVKLRVGRLSGVVPDLLQSAFETFKKGTLAEEARLEIEAVPYSFRCGACGAESFRDEPPYTCAVCGSADLELLGGMELVVEKIEVEIADS